MLKDHIKIWNKENVWHIGDQKEVLLYEISEIDKREESIELLEEDGIHCSKLKLEFENLVKIEERLVGRRKWHTIL